MKVYVVYGILEGDGYLVGVYADRITAYKVRDKEFDDKVSCGDYNVFDVTIRVHEASIG